jgi:hypothetical protein
MNLLEKVEFYLNNNTRKSRKEHFIIKEDFWVDLENAMDQMGIPRDWEMARRLSHFKMGNNIVPKCEICGVKDKKWHVYKNDYGFCSQSCSAIFTMDKRCSALGVSNIFQLDDIKESAKKTMIQKYGVDNISKLDSIKRKKEETMLKNHGKKYNVASDSIYKKYGVVSPAQIPEFFEKIQYNRFKKRNKFITPSGKTIYLQGNEPKGYQLLLDNGYNENEILYKKKDMPKIMYKHENKLKRYYPDFYVKKDNLIVEIKCDYTYKADLEKNILKEQATVNLGLNYKLVIIN